MSIFEEKRASSFLKSKGIYFLNWDEMDEFMSILTSMQFSELIVFFIPPS